MTIGEILKWFGTGYAGSLLGVLGLLVAGITFYASRKRKILVYAYRKTVIMKNFKNKVHGLEIKYNNDPIKNLSSTKIGIWNKGREPIKKDDIALKDPMVINFREEIIGEPELIFIKTQSNQISLNKVGNKIILDFDFLDFGDGATIQVFHTSKLVLKPANEEEEINIMDETLELVLNEGELETDKDSGPLFKYEKPFYITGKVIGSQEKIKLTSVEGEDFLRSILPASIFTLASFFIASAIDLEETIRFLLVFSMERPALSFITVLSTIFALYGVIIPFAKGYLSFEEKSKNRMNLRVIDTV